MSVLDLLLHMYDDQSVEIRDHSLAEKSFDGSVKEVFELNSDVLTKNVCKIWSADRDGENRVVIMLEPADA